jgi:anti-sigma regulatory factor (Ser/Thr protein kinase)
LAHEGGNEDGLSLRLAARPAQASLLRAHLRLWLAEHYPVDEGALDILLAANEAFGNAVTHARQPRSIAVHVDASISDGVVEIVVRDHGRWREHQRQSDGTRIGIALMQALMDSVELQASADGTTVRLRRVLRPDPARPDGMAVVPIRDRLDLLERSPIFAPLPSATRDRLAAQLIPFSASADETIIREGDQGDLFYVVGEGLLDVSVEGHHVATLGPDEPAGEIALLRGSRRTATIVAKEPVELFALTREDFLAAVNSHDSSRSVAERMVSSRLIGLEDVLGRTA